MRLAHGVHGHVLDLVPGETRQYFQAVDVWDFPLEKLGGDRRPLGLQKKGLGSPLSWDVSWSYGGADEVASVSYAVKYALPQPDFHYSSSEFILKANNSASVGFKVHDVTGMLTELSTTSRWQPQKRFVSHGESHLEALHATWSIRKAAAFHPEIHVNVALESSAASSGMDVSSCVFQIVQRSTELYFFDIYQLRDVYASDFPDPSELNGVVYGNVELEAPSSSPQACQGLAILELPALNLGSFLLCKMSLSPQLIPSILERQ
jgi:hypothetical protein